MVTPKQVEGFNVALNEALLLTVEFDSATRRVRVAVLITALTDVGSEYVTYWLELRDVSRLAVSLQSDRNDERAPLEIVTEGRLPGLVESFDSQAIYGWQFLNPSPERFAHLIDRWSMDWQVEDKGQNDLLFLFQDGLDHGLGDRRYLGILVWFGAVAAFDRDGNELPLDTVISAGFDYWDALYKNDPRTGHWMQAPSVAEALGRK